MTVDIKRLTAHLSQPQQDEIATAYKKQAENETAAFLWCFFLGWMGAHRFYLHQWGQAFIRLIIALIAIGVVVAGVIFKLDPTLVVLIALPFAMVALIWEIIDLFRIDDEVSARNLRLAETLIAETILADKTVEQQAQAKLDEVVHHVAAQALQEAQVEQAVTNEAAIAEQPQSVIATGIATTAAGEEIARGELHAEVHGGATVEQYEATTITHVSDDPNATKAEEQPVQPGTHDWSETETASSDEVSSGEIATEGALLGAAAGAAVAEGAHIDETTTRAHTESGFSTTDSVDTMVSESAAGTENMPEPESAIAVDMTPITAAEADASTWPDHPPIAEAATEPAASEATPGLDDVAIVAAAAVVTDTAASVPAGDATFMPVTPAADVTDMGGYADVAPVADVGTAGAVPQMVFLGDEAPQAVAESVPTAEPVAETEAAAIPAESYIPPTVPVVEAPVAEAEPVAAYVPVEESAAPAAAEETPTAEPETLAELAGLAAGTAAVAGATAAAEPEVAHTEEIEQTHQMLKRIRVTRQIKVNGEVVEETSAEELIDADADPEPVRQRLREQLHQQAAARMAELGITPDQENE